MPPGRHRVPWPALVPALVVGAAVSLPAVYLLLRAIDAEAGLVAEIVFRRRNLTLLANTLLLAASVLALATALALPLAWLSARSDLPGRRVLGLLGVLPLAVPGYVMAYALLGLGGPYGMTAVLLGLPVPRISGYGGALLVLGLYTSPYLFLNLRAALMSLDPDQEDAARSLGLGAGATFVRVVLPQLRPAYLAGALLVVLHVIGDFGVVSLMRYETFTYALFLQYTAAFDRTYAAWLALMLLGLTGTMLFLEARFLRRVFLHRTGPGTARRRHAARLGVWTIPAFAFAALVVGAGFVVPVLTVLFWASRGNLLAALPDVGHSLVQSVTACAPAALLAVAFAIPVTWLGVRHPRPLSRILERLAYFGYATPALAFALALIFFSLRTAPFLYQTLTLLVFAYAFHFLAEAIGPIRSALHRATPRLEEAARSLGATPAGAFRRVTLPVLRNGLVVGMAFVFISAMKELPMTFLLSPIGFESLAMNVWSHTSEALFAEAAPYALALFLFSAQFVWLLLLRENPA